jgi:hypothetical protein
MMSVQLLLFVIAILLVVIFWELCKINSLLKKTLLTAAQMTGGQQTSDTATAKVDRQ